MRLNSIGLPFLQQLPSLLSCHLPRLSNLDINLLGVQGAYSLERFEYQRQHRQ
jgi:hypothetical protein